MRFGDNMRNVAVTEGDKVGVQEVLGWEVNTWPVGTLVEYINAVTDAEVDTLMAEYAKKYDFDVIVIRFNTSKEECKRRQKGRGFRAVSDELIDRMNRFLVHSKVDAIDVNEIDGVIEKEDIT
jgi:L-arabinose isomerase